MNSEFPGPNPGDGPGRFIGGVFGFVFFGIGLTVLGFLWLTPFNEFGSPPLFFRIFGSFIAVAFVAMGGTIAYTAITGKGSPVNRGPLIGSVFRADPTGQQSNPKPGDGTRYSCTSCGAPLDSNADVSPHGDVKCSHCDRWFNIHS